LSAKEASKQNRTASAIWGWASSSGDTHVVLSGEIFQRDPVPITAARYFDEKSEFSGSVGGLGTMISNSAFGSRAYTVPGVVRTVGSTTAGLTTIQSKSVMMSL
jgi:hypothetical protein